MMPVAIMMTPAASLLLWLWSPCSPDPRNGVMETVGAADHLYFPRARCPLPLDACSLHDRSVVGFDLDMTLIDSRPGIGACTADSRGDGRYIDIDRCFGRLGPPLDQELAKLVSRPRRCRRSGPLPRPLSKLRSSRPSRSPGGRRARRLHAQGGRWSSRRVRPERHSISTTRSRGRRTGGLALGRPRVTP